MKKIYLIALFAATGTITHLSAQVTQTIQKKAVNQPAKKHCYLPAAVGLGVGTQGISADVQYPLKHGYAIRAGAAYLPFSANYVGSFADVQSDVNIRTKSFVNAHVLLDWKPFAKAGFTVSPGVGYFFHAKAIAHVQPKGNYHYNEVQVSGETIGSMDGTIDWNGVAPYLGANYTVGFHKSPLQLAFAAGSYYLPKPGATITGTKLLEDNDFNQHRFEDNIKNYRWLPLLQVSLIYQFKKA